MIYGRLKWEARTGPPFVPLPEMLGNIPAVSQVILTQEADQQVELEQNVEKVEAFDEKISCQHSMTAKVV